MLFVIGLLELYKQVGQIHAVIFHISLLLILFLSSIKEQKRQTLNLNLLVLNHAFKFVLYNFQLLNTDSELVIALALPHN